MNWIATYFFFESVLNDLIEQNPSSGVAPSLKGVYQGLYTAPTGTPTPASTMASITEANYDGYARQAVVWFEPFLDVLGPFNLQGANMQFRPTDAVVPNTITGAFLATAITGGNLLLAAAFVQPVALSGPLTALTISPVFQLAFTSNYGRPLVFA